jgi:hypothetical protein
LCGDGRALLQAGRSSAALPAVSSQILYTLVIPSRSQARSRAEMCEESAFLLAYYAGHNSEIRPPAAPEREKFHMTRWTILSMGKKQGDGSVLR